MNKLIAYVPRLLRDEGMIPLSDVSHYDHVAKLKTYYLAADVYTALAEARARGLEEMADVFHETGWTRMLSYEDAAIRCREHAAKVRTGG